MRKRIALLLILALALTAIFAACSQTAVTKIIPRWDAEESYVYTVSLCDFNPSPNATTRFRLYQNVADGEYYSKDFVVRTGEPFDSLDEVRPASVTGTFAVTVTRSENGFDTVTTEQNVSVTYATQDGKFMFDETPLAEVSDELKAIGKVTKDSITLTSVTKTTVTFSHDAKQAPVSSSTEVNGFYVGRAHQEVSNYKVSTTYNYEGKRPVAEITLEINGETQTVEDTLKGYSQGSFIDSNQLFMYARSFDKSTGSFADSPSVTVYNPFNQTRQSASFSFTATQNALLTNAGDELFTKLPTLGIVVGGMPFMLMESVPTLKDKLPDKFDAVGNGPDSAFFGSDPYAKHTPVRFRVGYISYELASYDSELWEALKAPATTAE